MHDALRKFPTNMKAVIRATGLISHICDIFTREIEKIYFQRVIIETFRKVFYILPECGVKT